MPGSLSDKELRVFKEREGARDAEDGSVKSPEHSLIHGKCRNQQKWSKLLAVAYVCCMPARTCLLSLDTSETWLRIPSCRIATPLPIFPLPPFPRIFGLAQFCWAVG